MNTKLRSLGNRTPIQALQSRSVEQICAAIELYTKSTELSHCLAGAEDFSRLLQMSERRIELKVKHHKDISDRARLRLNAQKRRKHAFLMLKARRKHRREELRQEKAERTAKYKQVAAGAKKRAVVFEEKRKIRAEVKQVRRQDRDERLSKLRNLLLGNED